MISSVRGTVIAVTGNSTVVEVGGIGLSVAITPQHAMTLRTGHEASLRTALIVREDDLALFGFRSAEELAVFDLLRGVTGVGPKSALGVLDAMTPADIASAVATENDAAFRKVSGIGPKTAKLIIVSLAGKLLAFAHSASSAPAAPATSTEQSVLVALVGLGWSERTAAQAVDDAVAAASEADAASVPALLRMALAGLRPGGGA
ncbi:Holliday junction branch migration protein RuvA [Marisediminicola senii]|uniref:Holliday junction branch migration protein RuvA n=1 Tax=Marisediminicola senii TaxID=2711233 RepID=UPI0013EBD9E4|nr:Holliday junction branch migration protein RuvA [Marisediminicola senii]